LIDEVTNYFGRLFNKIRYHHSFMIFNIEYLR